MDLFPLFGLDAWQWALACLIVAFATIVQFRMGVGFGLTSAPLLALFAPELVPVPVIILTLFTASWAMMHTWNGVDWREVTWSLSGRLTGALIGLALLTAITSQKQFFLVFGAFIALAVIMSVAGLRFRFSRPLLYVMGTISGLSASITSVGGPPMAIAYQDQSPAHARPNMSAYFGLGCVVLVVVLGAGGHIGAADLWRTAVLVPAFFVGLALSPLFTVLLDRNFRKVLLGISAAAATMLIWRGLA